MKLSRACPKHDYSLVVRASLFPLHVHRRINPAHLRTWSTRASGRSLHLHSLHQSRFNAYIIRLLMRPVSRCEFTIVIFVYCRCISGNHHQLKLLRQSSHLKIKYIKVLCNHILIRCGNKVFKKQFKDYQKRGSISQLKQSLRTFIDANILLILDLLLSGCIVQANCSYQVQFSSLQDSLSYCV